MSFLPSRLPSWRPAPVRGAHDVCRVAAIALFLLAVCPCIANAQGTAPQANPPSASTMVPPPLIGTVWPPDVVVGRPGSAFARSQPPARREGKLHLGLERFVPAVAAWVNAHGGRGSVDGRTLSNERVHVRQDVSLQVYLHCKGWDEGYRDLLQSSGFEVEMVQKEPRVLVQGWASFDAFDALEALPFVREITPPSYPTSAAWAQSDGIMRTKLARETYGFAGKGVKVGVMSDSSTLAARNEARASTWAGDDLPPEAELDIRKEGTGDNEGTAMMEIVHDMAPAARLAFYGPGTSVDMAAGIDDLVAAGCDIIVDDLGYFAEPTFEDGGIEAAIDRATAADVLYITSAHNQARGHFGALFSGNVQMAPFNSGIETAYDFGSRLNGVPAYMMPVTLSADSTTSFFLHWDDQWGHAANDYNLYVAQDTTANFLLGWSNGIQNGDDNPIEGTSIKNTTSVPITVYVFITRRSGADRNLQFWAVNGTVDPAYQVLGGSIGVNNKARNALTIAAIGQGDPGHDTIEPYSSQGPVQIAFPTAETRNKPDLTGIDGLAVTGAGGFSNPFFGTSAAAPSVAGVAAVLRGMRPDLRVDQIKTLLRNTAVDRGPAGFDTVFGHGLADAFTPADLARILRVNLQNTTGAEDGMTWATGFMSLTGALNAAQSGDEVWVKYQNSGYNGVHVVKPGVQVYGGFWGDETSRANRAAGKRTAVGGLLGSSMRHDGSAFLVQAGAGSDTVIDGFDIRGSDGTPVNGQRYGGGIYCEPGASPVISNNIFQANAANFGAGLFVSNSTALIEGNVFDGSLGGNAAVAGGGGIYTGGGSPTIRRNVFSHNTAGEGAAVFVSSGAPLIQSNLLALNSATASGAGIYLFNGAAGSILNNTIANNSAPGGGAGISAKDTSSPVIANNIVAFNTSGIRAERSLTIRSNDVFNTADNYAGSLVDQTGQTGNLSIDPSFHGSTYAVPERYRIELYSPVADAGDNAYVAAGDRDLEGSPRIQPSFDFVDMGAIEIPAPVVVRVRPDGNDLNDGSTWALAKKSVGAAISALWQTGGEVWIKEGFYPDTHVTLTSGVRLYGGFAGTETARRQRNVASHQSILDGSASPGRVITIANGASYATSVDGLVIQGGNNITEGGGIRIGGDGARPLIQNNTIRNNSASYGGGLRQAEGGAATIRDNRFIGNTAANNGGGLDFNQSTPQITGNVFKDNTATNGGGIAGGASDSTIHANTILNNTATSSGGGIWLIGGNPVITSNTITGNTDDGIYLENAGGRIASNNISANTGSGIWTFNRAWSTIVNNTIVENGGYGGMNGALYIGYEVHLTVANNIVAYNGAGIQGDGGNATVTSNNAYGNAAWNYYGMSDQTGTGGNVSVEPKLGRAKDGVLHLRPGSPMVDAGDPAFVAPGDWDVDLQSRVRGSRVDLGADEADGTDWAVNETIVRVSPTGSDANDGSTWALAKRTIQAAINAAGLRGGEVWVKAGTYPERLGLVMATQVYGGFAGAENARESRNGFANRTVIDGQQGGPVVTASGSLPVSTVLDGFVLTNGKGPRGGAVELSGVCATIRNNVITQSRSDNNVGGIWIAGQAPQLLSNLITGNAGIGVYAESANPRISGNVITTNPGGGIHLYRSWATIVNNTVAENGTRGIYVGYEGNATIRNNIVAFNAGGIQYDGGGGSIAFNNVFGNTAWNFYGTPSDPTGHDGNIGADPLFARDAIGVLHIQPASPARNAGDNASTLPTDADVDGQARVQDIRVDMGADESGGASFAAMNDYAVRVSPTGNDAYDGSTWLLAKKTIQAAIDQAAVHGGDVWARSGAYSEHLTLRFGVQVFGGFSGTETTRDARNWRANRTVLNGAAFAGSVVSIGDSQPRTTILDGFTITGGSTDNGGGIRSSASSPTLRNNLVTGNTATSAGSAVWMVGGSPLVLNNTITGNMGSAALYAEYGNPRIAGNVIAVNRSNGVHLFRSWATIANNTVVENAGVGIYVGYESNGTIGNNIVAHNASGIQFDGGGGSIKFNDVFGNTAWNYYGTPSDPTGTEGNISADPVLARDAAAVLHIQPTSPARNAGSLDYILTGEMDIDGQPRVQGAAVDMGADESNDTTQPLTPRVFRVSPQGNDANDGASWAHAKRTVQAGIDAAWAQGGEVWVKAGTYTERIALRFGVAVFGGFTGSETSRTARNWLANRTVLDGTGATPGPVVNATNGVAASTVLDGFTITNGVAEQGAGVFLSGSSPVIRNNLITRNRASSAAAGVWVSGGWPLLSANVITGNVGDAIYAEYANPRIVNNVLSANTGVGVSLYRTRATIVNNTVVENNSDGGGIYVGYEANATLTNNIVAFNTGGIQVNSGAATFRYNDVYGNARYAYMNVADPTGTDGNIGVDPKLARDAVGTLHIQADSSARNAGSNAFVLPDETDVDGQARIQSTTVDMGADESDGAAWVPNARIIHVSPTGSDANDGSTWSLAKKTIQAAIDAATVGGGDVWVKAGTYPERIAMKHAVQVYGGFTGIETTRDARAARTNRTIIDGQKAGSVVTVSGGIAASGILDGFTITNGLADQGAGVNISASSPTIRNNRIVGNVATGNAAGMWISGYAPTILSNVITGNTGDGIYAEYTAARIANNVISLNRNAGISLYRATPFVTNNTIVENGPVAGGILVGYEVNAKIANNIVAFNTWGIEFSSGTATLTSNDVFGNFMREFNVADPTGAGGNISLDPKLAREADGTLHIQPTSPAKDTGDATAVISTDPDIDGQSRVLGGKVDMGADESDGAVWVPNARIIRVSPTGSDANDGSTWSLAKKTIQAAIDAAAVGGGDVWVKAGTYNERLSMRMGVQVYGGFAGSETARTARNVAPNATIVDGKNLGGSVVTAADGPTVSAVLDGFTITGGSGENGGGIQVRNAAPTIRNNTITGNAATGSGGGLLISYGGRIQVTGNTFTGNTSGNGGAVYVEFSDPRLTGNVFHGNSGGGSGGAVQSYRTALTLVNNTIADNDGNGAVVAGYDSRLTLGNNIVAFNNGGLRADGGGFTLRTNDLHGNTGWDVWGLADPSGSDGNIAGDPLFLDRTARNYRPGSMSPGRDAGDDTFIAPDDLDRDGGVRIQGAHVDMGAYEISGVAPPTLADAARALRIAGGLYLPSLEEYNRLNVETGSTSASRVDVADAIRLARKATGKDPS